ncbi:unnamed protein product [marine sediment metagenome]|uniref:Uncharacterized protein n=1 Tax=marine sediment metagenome TaxID=412755 RepID=X1GKC2_9ZZZZ
MVTMRTQDEIVARIRDRKEHDFLGFEVSEYLDYLDFAHVKEFLKPDATPEQWEEVYSKAKTPHRSISTGSPCKDSWNSPFRSE